MKLFHPLHLTPDLIQSLAIDLSSMSKGLYPAPHRLGSSVLIEDWEIDYFWAPILKGKLISPENCLLGADISSFIWAFDENASWARTTAAIFRLGVPRPPKRGRAGRAFRGLLSASGDDS